MTKVDKLLAWGGNALLASVLVAIATPTTALAQAAEEPVAVDPRTTEEGRLIVPLSGTASVQRSGNLAASPTRVDTGLVEIGDASVQTIVLTHAGAAGAPPVVIEGATLIGGNADEYASDFGGSATLSPGQSIELRVTFTPLQPGPKSVGLRLDVAGESTPYVVLIEGRSRWPLTSDLELVDGTTFGLGQALVNKSVTKTVALQSFGDPAAPPINVTGIEIGGDTPEAFVVDFVPSTLAPGETLDVAVTMSSPLDGSKSAELTVFHDGNNPSVELRLEGEVVKPAAVPVNFTKSYLKVNGGNVSQGTSLQFGPDGNLYVAEMDGPIQVYAVTRGGKNDYTANKIQTIDALKNVANHNDDGSPNGALGKRLVTGIVVTGTAGQPIIYAVSSDPRQAAGPSGNDSNLDTNSGILHKLTKNGGGWNRQDLVRGLPRSEENHVGNGLLLMPDGKLLVVMGGHTNQGVPSNNFAQLAEYALSAAVLEIDVAQIGGGTYDIPTLDDEERPGATDQNDPFGGNDGKNQGMLVAGGPIKIFATGLRNAYDIVLAESGKLYTFDNGPNAGWGGPPAGDCVNRTDNGGQTTHDALHLIARGSYSGHPNPTRGNKANTFNDSNPQSPIGNGVPANPVECQYKASGQDGALTTINGSTNGMDEYTAPNFGGAMQGDLLAVSFNKNLYRLQLNDAGTNVTSKGVLSGGIAEAPLDVIAQGGDEVFPGTVWTVDWSNKLPNRITVLEPVDYESHTVF